MITDEINKRVAELRGWEFLPGISTWENRWFRGDQEHIGEDAPPYTTSGELMLELIVERKITLLFWVPSTGTWRAVAGDPEAGNVDAASATADTPPLAVALAYLEMKNQLK